MNVTEFVSRLDNVEPNGQNSYTARCPVHGDTHNSLSISEGNDGRILVNCFAGCSTQDIVETMGLNMSDLFSQSVNTLTSAASYKLDREHIYKNSVGEIVGKKSIWKAPGVKSKKVKCYRYENGQYIERLNNAKFPLYHLPELLSSKDTIIVAEGEKDVETLEKLGYTATSKPNGAGSKWLTEYNDYIKDRNVILLADNDKPGKDNVERDAALIWSIVKSVKVVYSENVLPGLREHGDISDIVAEIGEDQAKTVLDKVISETRAYSRVENKPLELPMYMYVDERTGKRKVNPALLAKAFKAREHYRLVKDPLSNSETFYFYENGRYTPISHTTMKGYIKSYITKYDESALKMRDVEEVLKALVTELDFISPEQFNGDEDIINFQNGVLNIKTFELAPHSPDVLSTIQIPCDWNPKAATPDVFLGFLNDLTSGDTERKSFLLQFAGACISNIKGYRTKKSLFLYGKGGTGKSQFKKLIERIIGAENCCAADLVELEERFGMASLYGKRLAGSNDMSGRAISELKRFKSLTGGDSVEIERKGKDKFSATFNGFFWFCTNTLPAFGGDRGQWVYDRIIPVLCDNPISEDQKDPFICDKMYAEREGIVHLAVTAFKSVYDNGLHFDIPSSSAKLLEQYKRDNSSVLTFFDECCIMRDEKAQIYKYDNCIESAIYRSYQNWCSESGYKAVSKKNFESEIADALDKGKDNIKRRPNFGRYYTFTLTAECKNRFGIYDCTP